MTRMNVCDVYNMARKVIAVEIYLLRIFFPDDPVFSWARVAWVFIGSPFLVILYVLNIITLLIIYCDQMCTLIIYLILIGLSIC